MLNFLRNTMNLTKLTLRKNPWICDCNTTDLLDFIPMKRKIIIDLQNVTCYDNNTLILSMTVTDFCPDYINNNQKQCHKQSYFILMNLLAGFIISISGLLFYIYQHSRILKLEETDAETIYDAFISYSQNDHDDFVMKELVYELENNTTPLKLCLSYRDWRAGE